MKIGISDGRTWKDQHYLKLKSFGFDFYDFKMSDTTALPYTNDDNEFEKYLKNEKKLADEAGVTIWQVHGPWRFPPRDVTESERSERLEKMKRSIYGTAILGAKYWVVHPLMPCGTQDILTDNVSKTREINLDFMSKLLTYAKQFGITICLENMPFLDFSLSSPTTIVDIVKEIDDPSFAMCLDTGHANLCRNWSTPAAAIREYGRYIKVLHVHDNRGALDDHLAPFWGSIDWKDFSRALYDSRFEGVLSLECAPSPKLPKDIYEDMYTMYSRIAKSIFDLHTKP